MSAHLKSPALRIGRAELDLSLTGGFFAIHLLPTVRVGGWWRRQSGEGITSGGFVALTFLRLDLCCMLRWRCL